MGVWSVGLGGRICTFIEEDREFSGSWRRKEGIREKTSDEKVYTYLFLAGGSKIRESGAHLEGERRKIGMNFTGLKQIKVFKRKIFMLNSSMI